MDRRKNIIKNTFKFMGSFILLTILFLIIFSVTILYVPTGKTALRYVPLSKNIEPDKLDWADIEDIGGRGIVIDSQGNVLKSYGESDEKSTYNSKELMDLFDIRGNDKTTFSYSTKDNNKLLIIYPNSVFTSTPTMDVGGIMGDRNDYFPLYLLIGLLAYLFFIYKIIGKLTKRLRTEFDLIRLEEDEKENMFFRGLAHDIKTPLSTVIAYSKALEDGIVQKEELEGYYKSIYNNGIILKERVDDMMELSTLSEEGIFFPEENDLLETIRRYIGDNYPWFTENHASINIEFNDKAKFITNYDKKLFERLLENLLQNSVHHNSKGVNIFIQWSNKDKTLSIYDDGKGISDKIKEHMWEPMVTEDESRTGKNLRGMGLANVKRIIELHGWHIEYDGKFKIIIK